VGPLLALLLLLWLLFIGAARSHIHTQTLPPILPHSHAHSHTPMATRIADVLQNVNFAYFSRLLNAQLMINRWLVLLFTLYVCFWSFGCTFTALFLNFSTLRRDFSIAAVNCCAESNMAELENTRFATMYECTPGFGTQICSSYGTIQLAGVYYR